MSENYYPRHEGEQGASSEDLHIAWLEDRIDVLTAERDEARAALRAAAERQREACADVVRELLDEEECDCPPEWPRCGLHRAALRLRATPLVTEVEP